MSRFASDRGLPSERGRVAVLAVLVLASCGARSGLENDREAVDATRPDAFRADAARDAHQDDAASTCPIGFDDVVDARLSITADDNFRLFVQGVLVDDTPRDWHDVQLYAVQVFRHPARRNTVAIEGTNLFRIDGLDRGVVADLTADIGGPRRLVTDASWRLSTSFPPGWSDVDFDASGWESATVEGMNGISPWGAVLGSSPAMWLWSYDSAIPASAKPEVERIAVRRDFYVDLTGALRDTPGDCP